MNFTATINYKHCKCTQPPTSSLPPLQIVRNALIMNKDSFNNYVMLSCLYAKDFIG